jgi:hypothetical protein
VIVVELGHGLADVHRNRLAGRAGREM